MLTEILTQLYDRDLKKLRAEIEQFSDEADLWKTEPGITNSAGNLCLHLTGNLQHFIGAVLGNSGYVRDRDAEFANKNISRDELLATIDSTAAVVRETLGKLTDDDLAEPYPPGLIDQDRTVASFMTHLTTHFNYHLGQINYHRRLLTKD